MCNRIFCAAVLGLATTLAGCSAGKPLDSWNQYGTCDLNSADRIVALDALDRSATGPVIVQGIVGQIGPVDGRWMEILAGDQAARVKFKDGAFTVPLDASGHRVVVVGFGQPVLLDIAYARQLAEQAGQSRKSIDAITRPVSIYEIEATGLYIERSSAWPSDRR